MSFQVPSIALSKLIVWAVAVYAATAYGQGLFQWGEKIYREEDLSPQLRQQVFEIELQYFQGQQRVIEEALIELYFDDQARRSQKSASTLRDEALAVKDPTELELRDFYKNNRQKIPYEFEQIRSELQRYLTSQKIEARKAELLVQIKADSRFKSLIAQPQMPSVQLAVEGFFKRGKSNASVQIVEFGDYKCPHCADSAAEMEKLFAKYGDRVEFVFIDFPILQGVSRQLASAAYCAGQQQKYWEYHKLLFANQRSVKESSIDSFGKQIGLDQHAFRACRESTDAAEYIARGRDQAEGLGVSGTPTVFINGQRFVGRPAFEPIAKRLDELLAAGR